MPVIRFPARPQPEELPEDIPARIETIDKLLADAAELLKEYPDKKYLELRLYLSERITELTRMKETYQKWMTLTPATNR